MTGANQGSDDSAFGARPQCGGPARGEAPMIVDAIALSREGCPARLSRRAPSVSVIMPAYAGEGETRPGSRRARALSGTGLHRALTRLATVAQAGRPALTRSGLTISCPGYIGARTSRGTMDMQVSRFRLLAAPCARRRAV